MASPRPAQPPVTVGPAEEAETERLLAIHLTSFPDARGTEPRKRNFHANARGGFERLVVARRDGLPVGHAFLFDMSAGFGGAMVRLGGIASVGVAQEARGSGVARALVGHLHERSLAEGHALTMLYAFRQGFYARLGYVQAPGQRALSIDPRAFASLVGRGIGRDHQLRMATGDDLPRLRELYELEAKRHSGWVMRTEASWLRLLADERTTVLVAVGNGVTRGAIFTSLEQDEPHARTALRVDDILAEDASARAALYAHLYAQRDQISEILLEVPEGDPLELALVDADGHRFGDRDIEHPLGIHGSGPMIRLLDPVRALAARGYPAAAADTFVLEVEGGVGGLDAEQRRLAVHAGGSTAARVEETRALADLRLDTRALTAMTFGGWRASQLADLGWVEPLTAGAIERADRLFALAPFFSRDPF